MSTTTLPSVERDLALESIVRTWANDPARWRRLVRFAEPRVRIPLYADNSYEVRLLTWLPGQGSGFHDHGGSAGCLAVVTGSVWETVVGRDGHACRFRHQVGDVSSFRDDIIHNVRNLGSVGAVTIHAYRPELTDFRRYEFVDGALTEIED